MKHRYALRALVSMLGRDEPLQTERRLFWHRLAERAVDERLRPEKTARNYVSELMSFSS